MSTEFLLGLVCGGSVVYVATEFLNARRAANEDVKAKLDRCTLEAIRRDASLDLNSIDDEKLVTGVLTGINIARLKTDPAGDEKPR